MKVKSWEKDRVVLLLKKNRMLWVFLDDGWCQILWWAICIPKIVLRGAFSRNFRDYEDPFYFMFGIFHKILIFKIEILLILFNKFNVCMNKEISNWLLSGETLLRIGCSFSANSLMKNTSKAHLKLKINSIKS